MAMLQLKQIDSHALTSDVCPRFLAGVDPTVMSGYERLQADGDPDLIVELIDLYLADVPLRMTKMREALRQRNWLQVKREAHNLRGSSGNLGAVGMAAICEEVERTVSEHNRETEIFMDRLERAWAQTRSLLANERQRRLP
ncbi:MAG: two-component system, sensor histidine kinase and response regulator [Blastocatellia bacterium]|jgi:HPt (histidine-containing phosphotransfer) domain-containing protein|nr:two-component system, sensor histidine kinase and response regulator [Blastocatellia bacterium]